MELTLAHSVSRYYAMRLKTDKSVLYRNNGLEQSRKLNRTAWYFTQVNGIKNGIIHRIVYLNGLGNTQLNIAMHGLMTEHPSGDERHVT